MKKDNDKILAKLIQDDFKKSPAPDDFTDLVMAKIDAKQAELQQPILKWYWLVVGLVTIISFGIYVAFNLSVDEPVYSNLFRFDLSELMQYIQKNSMTIGGICIGLFFIIADQFYRKFKRTPLLI